MPVFNQATALVRRFFYRLPRLPVEVPLDFIFGDTVVLGICLDISESGLRANFSIPVKLGSEGLITLYRSECAYQCPALVESVKGEEVRVRFLFSSEDQRAIIRGLLELLSSRSK